MADFDCPEMLKAIDEINNNNFKTALVWLIPLANEGNPKAQCNLAALYQCGQGMEADGRQAVELYLKVSNTEHR
jgi:TPR repeat protein